MSEWISGFLDPDLARLQDANLLWPLCFAFCPNQPPTFSGPVSCFTLTPAWLSPSSLLSPPSGYTMNKVFVLELFLLLPQWSAKAVNLSCPFLPLLVKKKTRKKTHTKKTKQNKSPNHSCIGDPTATLENKPAVMIAFIEGTQADRVANATVSQYHNDPHRLVNHTSGTLFSSWVPTLRVPP